MEHAFPPPFRWELLTHGKIVCLVIAAVFPLVGGIGIFVCRCLDRRRHGDADEYRAWIFVWFAFFMVAVMLWFALRGPFLSNWRQSGPASLIFAGGFGLSMVMAFVEMARLDRIHKRACQKRLVWKLFGSAALAGVALWVLIEATTARMSAVSGPGPDNSRCQANLQMLGTGLAEFEEARGHFPVSADGEPAVSWRVQILDLLPYGDGQTVLEAYDRSKAWDAPKNLAVAQERQYGMMYRCRARRGTQTDAQRRFYTDYVMLTGPGTFSDSGRRLRKDDVVDGTSNTIALTEAAGLNIVWTEPRDVEVGDETIGVNLGSDALSDSRGIASSWHMMGANVLFADGLVRNLNENIDPRVLKALTTVAGGEPIEEGVVRGGTVGWHGGSESR